MIPCSSSPVLRLAILMALVSPVAILPPLRAMESVVLPVGANHQAIMDANPPGTRYVIASGVHRGVMLVPKDGDTISGQPGAVLNGCLALESWQFDGQWWVHDAPVLSPMVSPVGIDCPDPLCRQPQDFYLDGRRLRAVDELGKLASPLQWFLDRENSKIYLLADPTGRLAELGGPARTAIDCAPPGQPPASGVTIEDLTIEKYPCPPQVGAIRIGTGIVRRCTVTGSHAYGIQLMLGAAQVLDCYLADNGMCGIGGSGVGALIEGCEIAYNVWPVYAGLAWDNGGVKVAGTQDTTFRRNYIHHNNGPGLWWDIRTTGMIVEDNVIEFNHWEGILMEISEQAVIRRNICRWNGTQHRRALWGAQICVQNGSSAHIHHNYLETGSDFNSPWGSRQGVMVINQLDRAWDEGVFGGDFSTHEILVEDNLLVMPHGGHSGVDYGTLRWSTYDDFLNADLMWRRNRYLVGQPLDHRWSWRLLPDWDTTVARWLVWEEWTTHQDTGSTLEPFGPHDFPPSGTGQHALITATTGHDYVALKNSLLRRPPLSPIDRDEDTIPDEWELRFREDLTILHLAGDSDADGLTDAVEFSLDTNPLAPDSDGDGLTDRWERDHQLDPLVYDSHLDSDGDGRSAFEEYQDGTDLAVGEPPSLPAPETALSFWLSPTSGLTSDETGRLESWITEGPEQLKVGWFGEARRVDPSPTEIPLVSPGDMLLIPGAESRFGDLDTGFTLSFVFRPSSIQTSREWTAVMSNEVYLEQGFRLRLESGYLVLSAGQSGGSLVLAGHTRLTAGRPHVITITVAPNGQGGALYLDGRLEDASPLGVVVPSSAPLMLGNTNGVTPQPGAFGDVALFRRQLSHLERRSLESFLTQKFRDGLAPTSDRDRDGLPDSWETAHRLDPLTPSAFTDADQDGATNRDEFTAGLDPQSADSDSDGLPDGWELTHAFNPLVDDQTQDPDEDGLTNLDEFKGRSHPRIADLDPPSLLFHRMRLWWRADSGLHTGGDAQPAEWRDSAASGNHARPPAGQTIAMAATPWAGKTVPRLTEQAITSSSDVDSSTQWHVPGFTVTLAIRPPAVPAPAPSFQKIFSLGQLVAGVQGDRLVLRSLDGALSAQSEVPVPADPFILTCLASPAGEPARLLVNGTTLVTLAGPSLVEIAPLHLGGPEAWPADIAEVVLHAGLLAAIDRRFLESVLRGKWLASGPQTADADQDGLPNWWEHQACSHPTVADADGDADWNGESNAAAYAAGRPGFIWTDADTDGMHDAWESAFGLDPTQADALEDPDLDGIPNALEHALLSLPRTVDSSPPWQVNPADPAAGHVATVLTRLSHRAWSGRARLQANPALVPQEWRPLPTGRLTPDGASAVSIESVTLSPDLESSASSAFLRLALFPE